MFDQSLLERSHTQARKPYSALASFGLQTGLMALLIAIPLLHPEGIELLRPVAAPVLYRLPEVLPAQLHTVIVTTPTYNPLRFTMNFARHAQAIRDEPAEVAPDAVSCPPYCGSASGDPNSLPLGTAPIPPVLEKPKPSTPMRIRVSEVEPGYLIQKVQPAYPMIAKSTRTEGEVRLAAVIGRDGLIQNLRLISGHPLLAAAAMDAVKQWRYRPHLLNGEPVEVETTVIVHFTLSR